MNNIISPISIKYIEFVVKYVVKKTAGSENHKVNYP